MDNVNKTLYIPLYGKALVSRKGILLHDPKAEEIWAAGGFPLKGKSRSKWLALYMGIRAAVFDGWTAECAREEPEALILHIGCGLDARVLRTGLENEWYDIDFPEVIGVRRGYYPETERYHLLGADIREVDWLRGIPSGGNVIVVMEGVSMYLDPEELAALLGRICLHFDRVRLLADCYTSLAAKASRYKNPINDVGVTRVYGLDDPTLMTKGTTLQWVREHEMTPDRLKRQLQGAEGAIFRALYGGAIARRMYRLYEFDTETETK